jgi:hypothetical protein
MTEHERTEVENTLKTHGRVIFHCEFLGGTSSGLCFRLDSLYQNSLVGYACRSIIT